MRIASPVRAALVLLVPTAVASLLAMALSVMVGSSSATIARAVAEPGFDREVILTVRLPRALLTWIAGAGLSAVGVALQAILRNPLAEPYVLGVSGGAAFGAVVAIAFGLQTTTLLGASLVPVAALVGGFTATLLVHVLGSAQTTARAVSLLLAGTVVNAIASAGITLVKTLVSASKTQEVLYWLMGFVDVPSNASLGFVALYTAIGVGILLFDAGRLNVLALGEDAASHLGVKVRALEARTLLAASLVTGAIVSVTGLIGFVGLVVPHALRRVAGPDVRKLLPASVFLGGATLLVCDAASRGAFRWVGRELPIGAVTALIGGPLFLALLRKKRAYSSG